ncbi:MAG: LuxR C-terminal-related transcriptional regulator [bacterium]|nr:LuxR C-terminal-related transcriptional regulator [bacterium]
METRLLATKLFVPVTRAACVPRLRLHRLLERGTAGPLTLLSAAAGSGKTTLVANWLRASARPVAWFSLDERDNDLGRFLRYFIAAIARHHEGFGDALLVDPKAASTEDPLDLATDLVNAIAKLGEELLVVLDDVHVLDADPVNEVMAFLADACPPNLHLVMTTRVDPDLPLSRMRARGQLTEIRAPDLRFTREESSAFLGDVMGVRLADEQVARLESRTEGWAVGLQMAALSLQGRDDAASFIEGFAGSHRYVLDYLMDEVLQRLPDGARSFLMQTSILRQLTAPLVDSVTGRDDGATMLEGLERSNVFTIPLDNERTAYRYHHLFGTLLRHELEAAVSAEELRALHRRASDALESLGQCEDAVDHALLAEDYDRAAGLLVPLVMGSTIRGESHALAQLLARFPPAYAHDNPMVTLLNGWLDYYQFKFSALSRRLGVLRSARGRELSPSVAAELELLIGMVACEAGDLETAAAALDRVGPLPDDRPYLHAFESMHRAVLALVEDRLDDARAELGRTREAALAANDPYAVTWVEWQFAHVDLLRGELSASMRAHEQLLEEVTQQYPVPPSSSLVGFGTGIYVALHQHDLARAEELSTMASSLGSGLGRQHGYVSCLLMPRAQLQVQAGRGEDWQATLDQGIRHLDALDQMTSVPRIEAQRVRLAMHPRSDVDARSHAARWLQTPGIRDGTHEVYRPNPMPGVQVEQPRFVLARALSTVGEHESAREVATELRARAKAAGRRICEVEALLLLAEIADAQGQAVDLGEAVRLAAPQMLVGPFLEFEALMQFAISAARTAGQGVFATALSAAHRPACTAKPAAVVAATPSAEPIVVPAEALSDRELEVLGLVAMGMSNAEASRKLFIAPSTVKKHLEHIYGKLGVNRRTQAVARARTLGLIGA